MSYSVKSSELSEKLLALGVVKGQTNSMDFTVSATTGTNFTIVEFDPKTVSVKLK